MTISLKQVHIIMGQHMSPMVTTNQKPTTDTQKPKRKETKHTTEEKSNHNMRKKQTEKNYKNWETKNKNGNRYVLIINYFNCQWSKCSNQQTQGGFFRVYIFLWVGLLHNWLFLRGWWAAWAWEERIQTFQKVSSALAKNIKSLISSPTSVRK